MPKSMELIHSRGLSERKTATSLLPLGVVSRVVLLSVVLYSQNLVAQTVSRSGNAPSLANARDLFVPMWHRSAIWSGKMLLSLDDNLTSAPLVDAIDRDLNHDALAFTIPGAPVVNIRGLGGGYDGSILVCGDATSSDSRRAGFIARISPDRKQRTLIQTEPYRPEAVALAADGVIWAVGLIFDGEVGSHNIHNVVRRYNSDGKLQSSQVMLDAKTAANSPGDGDMASRLAASKDHVGWMTNGAEYIEFSLDGSVAQRFDTPSEVGDWNTHGFALTEEDDLIVSGKDGLIFARNRANRSWIRISIPGRTVGGDVWIFGADEETMMYQQDRGIVGRATILRLHAPAR